MTTLAPAAAVPNARPATPASAAVLINGSVLIGLLVAYPLARFLIGSSSLTLLYIATLLWAVSALSSGRLRLSTLFWFAPLVVMPGIGWLHAMLADRPIEANYFLFTTLYILFLATLMATQFSYSPRATRWIGILFCLSLLPFALSPGLIYKLGSGKYLGALVEARGEELLTANDWIAPEERFHAYFIHANELGVFAAAIFFFLLLCQQDEKGLAARMADAATAAALGFFVLTSGSATAMVAVVAALVLRFMPAGFGRSVCFSVLAFQFVSQFAFPGKMAAVLKSGSFYWRYTTAEEIVAQAPLMGFDPLNVGMIGTWPHSIFLDYTFLLGIAGAVLLFVIVSIYALFRVPAAVGAGILTFFVCAAVQPAGAMPSSLMLLAGAIAVLKSIGERRAPGGGSMA